MFCSMIPDQVLSALVSFASVLNIGRKTAHQIMNRTPCIGLCPLHYCSTLSSPVHQLRIIYRNDCVWEFMWMVHRTFCRPQTPYSFATALPQREKQFRNGSRKPEALTLSSNSPDSNLIGHEQDAPELAGVPEALPYSPKYPKDHLPMIWATIHRTPPIYPCPCPEKTMLLWKCKEDMKQVVLIM